LSFSVSLLFVGVLRSYQVFGITGAAGPRHTPAGHHPHRPTLPL